MIPEYLLVHDVTVVHPATSDDPYGNTAYDYGPAATRVQIRGWLQQDTRIQLVAEGGEPLQSRWLLVTNSDEVTGRDRIEWTGPAGLVTFSVDGQPAPAHSPGGYHHTETQLRVVNG